MTDAAARLYSSRPLSWALDISMESPATQRPRRNSGNPEKTRRTGHDRPRPWEATADDLRSLADVRRSIVCTCLVSLDKEIGSIQADPGYTRRFVWDVAGALHIPRSWVIVDRIFEETAAEAHDLPSERNGMARIHLVSIGTDEERGGREATDLAKELQKQAKSPQSALKTGGSTCDVVAVEILFNDAPHPRKTVTIDEVWQHKAKLAELRASNDRLVARLERCTCHEDPAPRSREEKGEQSNMHEREIKPAQEEERIKPSGFPLARNTSPAPDVGEGSLALHTPLGARSEGSGGSGFRKVIHGGEITQFSSRRGSERTAGTENQITAKEQRSVALSHESARVMRQEHAEFKGLETTTHRIVQFHMASALFSVGLAMLSHETWMDQPEARILTPLKICQSICTSVLVSAVCWYYRCNRRMRVLQGRSGVRSWQSAVTVACFVLEMLVIIPHPFPFLETTFEIYESEQERYYFDTLLTSIVMLRVYVALRFFRSTMIYRHKYTRALGITKHDVKINSVSFWIKYALERDSVDTLLAFFVIFLCWAAYMIRLAESGGMEERFQLYQDCMWFVVVTASTTGYGDIAPETTLGRSMAVCIMVVGICSAAIVTALLTERTRLRSDESRFVTAVSQARLNTRKRVVAAHLIVAFFRFVVRVRRKQAPRDRVQALETLIEKAAVTRRKRLWIARTQREVPCGSALLEDVHAAIFNEDGLKEMLLQVNSSIRKDMHLFHTDLEARLDAIERKVSAGTDAASPDPPPIRRSLLKQDARVL